MTGMILYAFAYPIVLVLEYYLSIYGVKELIPIDVGAANVDIEAAHVTIVLGLVLPPIINKAGAIFGYTEKEARRRAAFKSGNHIELMIAESFDNRAPVESTLKNGKSYIGLALEQGIAGRGESDVTLIPFASGYRDKDTHKLNLTIDYTPAIEAYQKEEARKEIEHPNELLLSKRLRVAFPMSEIMSARFFDSRTYEILNP